MKASDLFTRPAANAGKSVEIPGPDGKPTGITVTLHHVDCDAFRKKRAAVFASAAALPADTPQAERIRLRDAMQVELLASLVSAWTLEDPCTPENVIELLSNAPYLADWIDRKSEQASIFFGKSSAS